MRKFVVVLVIIVVLIAGGYLVWSNTGRGRPLANTDLRLEELRAIGTDQGRGNVVGIQAYMFPYDYADSTTFRTKLAGYMDKAKQAGYLNDKTVVLFPEYIGAWLVVAGEKTSVYTSDKVDPAMQTMVLSNIGRFLYTFITAPDVPDKLKYSLFRFKAAQMAEAYHNAFSWLAKEYGVTIIAGSILLPDPKVQNNRLIAGSGQLYNVTAIYNSDGTIQPDLVKKVYPIGAELPFLACGLDKYIPVFDLPIGKTAVLICADSWYPGPYKTIESKGAEIIAVPSYLSPDNITSQPWRGYDGHDTPKDVDQNDVKHLTESQAWLKYSLNGRIKSVSARNGFNVFLRGKLWDLGSDGYSIIIKDGQLITGRHIDGASIISLWF
jgi:hypothetical protein